MLKIDAYIVHIYNTNPRYTYEKRPSNPRKETHSTGKQPNNHATQATSHLQHMQRHVYNTRNVTSTTHATSHL